MNLINHHHTNQSEQGFTLIELIVVIFLFGILLIGLLNIFDWQNKVYSLEQADVFATGSARHAMNNLTLFIAQGYNIVSSRTVNGTNYTTSGSTVIIQIPTFNSAGNLVTDTYDHIIFSASGANLHMITEVAVGSARKGGTKLLSDKITTFSLTYNNANPTLASQVAINLITRSYYRQDKFVTATLTETIFLRNK